MLPGTSPPAARTRISVVIPVRDDQHALAECLRRLAAQTLLPDEVVVVDNGSTDGSAAVAREWGARVVTEPRPGIPIAAATGYDAADGDLLLRCDADSRIAPTWVQHGAHLLGDPSVVAATGWGRFDLPRPAGRVVAGAYLGAYYLLGHLAAGRTVLWGSCLAIRRDAWLAARPRVATESDVHDDLDLAMALDPRATVVLDRTWVVGVSARSVHPGRQWLTRWRRAGQTLVGQWRSVPPWHRWALRLRG